MRLRLRTAVLAPVLVLVGLMAIAGPAQATVILAWDFAGLVGNEPSAEATTVDFLLEPTSIVRGSGLTPRTEAGLFNSRAWPTAAAGLPTALAGDDYLEWSIEPGSGAKYSLDSVQIKIFRVDSFFVQGPNTFHLRSSLDGFASDIGAPLIVPFTTLNSTVDLSTIPALQDATGSVTFRLYGYGTDGTDGWGGIGRQSGNDLIFEGSIVPEPGTLVLLASGALALGIRRRRARMGTVAS